MLTMLTERVEMIYCPKCGISTERLEGGGNALLSCSTCGVVWSEFLELMANDALWPDIVRRDKHDIICPKCGYERLTGDEAKARITCPDCRVSYTESLLAKNPTENSRTSQTPTADGWFSKLTLRPMFDTDTLRGRLVVGWVALPLLGLGSVNVYGFLLAVFIASICFWVIRSPHPKHVVWVRRLIVGLATAFWGLGLSIIAYYSYEDRMLSNEIRRLVASGNLDEAQSKLRESRQRLGVEDLAEISRDLAAKRKQIASNSCQAKGLGELRRLFSDGDGKSVTSFLNDCKTYVSGLEAEFVNLQRTLLETKMAPGTFHNREEITGVVNRYFPGAKYPSADEVVVSMGDRQYRVALSQATEGAGNQLLVKSVEVLPMVVPDVAKIEGKGASAENQPNRGIGDCYEYGSNVARVYLSNIHQMASMDIMSSQMMETACSDASISGSHCKSECVSGFKSAVKAVLK